MISGTLSAAARAMNGSLHGADRSFSGVSTDTRSIRAGQLFVALEGPNFDGARFVVDAERAAAAGAVVREKVGAGLAQIRVTDTLRALGELAAAWRRQMPATVVGLTGSNGKTTLKEMIASCLGGVAETLATHGNLNNEIGVPLMLSQLSREHRFAVIEMGANHAGEIERLTACAAPDIVAITNAGAAHLEGFGSLEGVAKAKGEILAGQPRPRAAILNADDAYYDYWCSVAKGVPVISFGASSSADVRVAETEAAGDRMRVRLALCGEKLSVDLPLVGPHNAVNAAAAAAVASALGVGFSAIRDGLERMRPVGGRLAPRAGRNGVQVYDDSYNANPDSVKAAAAFIGAQAGESWLVLGSMAELGAEAEALHAEVGHAARDAGVARLYAVGPHVEAAVAAFGEGGAAFRKVADLSSALVAALAERAPERLLVKGSRSMRMERVVNELVESASNGEAA